MHEIVINMPLLETIRIQQRQLMTIYVLSLSKVVGNELAPKEAPY